MPDIKLGSLFDGIGVFPLAASRCGIRPVWASEIEKAPISITKRHFPDMAHLGDITKVDGGKIPPVHVITFGSPCQNLSLIGNRSGLAGAKSSLFYQAFRIIQEMRDAMPGEAERKGLGTPATRAAIIEKLVSGGFMERKGKNLIPTKAGINLVTVLPELLTSPKLTADWEQRLNEVAKGQASPEDFMDGIEAMAAELVRKYSHISEDGQKLFQPEKETVGLCPRCGMPVYEGKKNFACSDRACQFVMWKNDRFWTSRRKEITRKMAADLLKKGRTSVKGMWSEKKDSTYDAVVILDDTGGKYVNFKLEFPKRKDGVYGKK